MARAAKQTWVAGNEVRIGFLTGFIVLEKVASPGNWLPDGYVLQRAGKLYAFIPHSGLTQQGSVEDARNFIEG